MWNWSNVQSNYWENPAQEMYYLAARWQIEINQPNILDIGAGIGRNALFFAKKGCHVTALDTSEMGLQAIREKNKAFDGHIETIHADMHQLPFETDTFDCLLAYHSIYHTNWEGIRDIIAEMYRVLKPDGEMFVTLLSTEDSEYIDRKNEVCQKTLLKSEEEGSVIEHLYLSEEDIRGLFPEKDIIEIKHIKDYYGNKTPCHFHMLLKNNRNMDFERGLD